MSAEYILDALCTQSSLTAFFGTRIACGQLPQDTDRSKPCLVFEVISDGGKPNVNLKDGKDRSRCYFRINVFSPDIGDVLQGQSLVESAVDKRVYETWGNKKVLLIVKMNQGQSGRDDAVGVWWRADDYDMQYLTAPVA